MFLIQQWFGFMKVYSFLVMASSFILPAPLSNGSGQEPRCQARLVAKQQEGMLTLTGQCQNLSDQAMTLRYELTTRKQGVSGTSQNAQSGLITVAAHQTASLSQTSINLQAADVYEARLRMLDDKHNIIAQDSIIHRP
jgi:hypothetical protein